MRHGNEDTFTEMLRIKRSVEAAYSQVNYTAAEMLTETPHVVSDAEAVSKQISGSSVESDMALLDRQAAEIVRVTDVQSSVQDSGQERQLTEADVAALNPEEVEIEDAEDEVSETAFVDEVEVIQLPIPAAVFGSAISALEKEKSGETGVSGAIGALERFKRRRTS